MKRTIILLFSVALMSIDLCAQAYPDRHNTSWTEAWVSCQESQSQNEKRDPSHWVMYDLGDQYALQQSTIWNYNVPDSLDRGVQDIVIDYSNDGVDWTELQEFQVPIGPGSSFYEGVDGPDFDGVLARYILISVLSNHGDGQCVGMSEFRARATIATSTNIVEGELDVELELSPNPATNYTVITVKNSEEKNLLYSVTDPAGRLLRQGKMNSDSQQINTSTLSAGVYSISVHNENGIQSSLLTIINN